MLRHLNPIAWEAERVARARMERRLDEILNDPTIYPDAEAARREDEAVSLENALYGFIEINLKRWLDA